MKTMGFDCDDTKIKFREAWEKYHLEQYGEAVGLDWDTPETLRRGHEFVHSHHHHAIEAVEGAVETLAILKERRQLVCITARDAHLSGPTIRLIAKLFPGLFKGIYFQHYAGRKMWSNKGEMCKTIGVSEFMDDNVKQILTTRDAGVQSFLFHTEENKGVEVPGVVGIRAWKELLDHVP